ncbi:PP2C family protein-serine/threonine phosphatase [Brevibacillus ginsengisoli]|uniref:PP2C family protein-serine/threonine phosphatase n=1 Tax=Brevibacillus ginsengisoli TaxID=363854 RepID=UPI003CEB4011
MLLEWGDPVVWYTIVYIIALIFSLYFLLSSRHLVTSKRWYDFSFILGNAFLLWGLSHILDLHPDFWYQLTSHFATYGYYVFLLLAFRSFPLPPHIYYDRWKNNLDIAVITVLHVFIFLAVYWNPQLDERLDWILHFQTGMYILGTCFTVLRASWNIGRYQPNNLLLIGCMLFMLIDAVGTKLPPVLMFSLTLCTFAMILISHNRMRTMCEKVILADDSRYLYQRFTFILRDERVHWLYLFGILIVFLEKEEYCLLYLVGMMAFGGLILIRCLITRRQNRHILSDLLAISSNLENHFAQNLEQLQSQNTALTNLLDVKQRYEKVLQLSNEQNVQQINYDNIYQLIEEYVHVWYSIMVGFNYVRLTFESADHEVYYDTSQGKRGIGNHNFIVERLIVDEKGDSHRNPRYVMVEVEVEGGIVEGQRIFVQQLAVHVRRLFQRCIQTQQSLELRLMEQEMAIASRIQSSLIPMERLRTGMVQAKAVYLPMDYVGGDYVDFVKVNERFSCFLIADISGHGVPASLLTTGIRILFRAVLQTTHSPSAILTRLNRLLYEDLSAARSYVTMFVVVIDQVDQVLRVSRAGHPCPLYVSPTKQLTLPCKRGMGLGLMEDAIFEEEEVSIEEEFLLLLYTDGLTDLYRKRGVSGIDEWFKKIQQTAELNQAQDRISAVEQLIFEETKQSEQTDDITVLIIEMKDQFFGQKGGDLLETM